MRHRILFAATCVSLYGAVASATEYAITDLGTLGGTYSAATSNNATGEIVGTSTIAE